MNPVDGLTYWYDPATLAWKALGRTDIPITPDIGGGYGSTPYGERPYGD